MLASCVIVPSVSVARCVPVAPSFTPLTFSMRAVSRNCSCSASVSTARAGVLADSGRRGSVGQPPDRTPARRRRSHTQNEGNQAHADPPPGAVPDDTPDASGERDRRLRCGRVAGTMRTVLNASLVCSILVASAVAPAAAQLASEAYTQPYQRKAFEVYRTIVGIRSAAGQGQVPKVAAYLADQFRQGGFPAKRRACAALQGRDGRGDRGAGGAIPGRRLLRQATDPAAGAHGRSRRAPRGLGARPLHARRRARVLLRSRRLGRQVRRGLAHRYVPATEGRRIRTDPRFSSSRLLATRRPGCCRHGAS